VDSYIDTLLHSADVLDIVILLIKCTTFGFFITLIPIRLGLNASQDMTSIPIAVLNGMVKVFMAIVTIEVLSSILRFF
jgi:phospholipid/cholesterol/gamma-HCH transport system permease protein